MLILNQAVGVDGLALMHDAVHRKRSGIVTVVDDVGARKRRAVLVLEMVVGKVAAGVRVSKASGKVRTVSKAASIPFIASRAAWGIPRSRPR